MVSIDDVIQLNILNILGADKLPEEKRKQILADMTRMLLEQVVMRISDALPADKKEEFYRVFGGAPSSDDEKRAFLRAHVSDFDEIVLQEVMAFKYAVAQFAEDSKITA
ncbi:MAG: DUF5663 domain-containing protein [Patescibacteria group bacterium]